MKSALHTTNPIALRYLMSETLFSVEDGDRITVANETGVREEISTTTGATSAAESQVDPAPVVDQMPAFAFLGENKQRYLFVTNDAQSEYMSAAGMDAFTKTLAARNLTLNEVAVLNVARYAGQAVFSDVISFFNPQVVVLLGANATLLQLPDIGHNTVHQVGEIPVFQTYSFDVLLVDAEKKSVFWPILKSLLV